MSWFLIKCTFPSKLRLPSRAAGDFTARMHLTAFSYFPASLFCCCGFLLLFMLRSNSCRLCFFTNILYSRVTSGKQRCSETIQGASATAKMSVDFSLGGTVGIIVTEMDRRTVILDLEKSPFGLRRHLGSGENKILKIKTCHFGYRVRICHFKDISSEI